MAISSLLVNLLRAVAEWKECGPGRWTSQFWNLWAAASEQWDLSFLLSKRSTEIAPTSPTLLVPREALREHYSFLLDPHSSFPGSHSNPNGISPKRSVGNSRRFCLNESSSRVSKKPSSSPDGATLQIGSPDQQVTSSVSFFHFLNSVKICSPHQPWWKS